MSFCEKHEKGYRYGQPCQTCEIERINTYNEELQSLHLLQEMRIAKLEGIIGSQRIAYTQQIERNEKLAALVVHLLGECPTNCKHCGE